MFVCFLNKLGAGFGKAPWEGASGYHCQAWHGSSVFSRCWHEVLLLRGRLLQSGPGVQKGKCLFKRTLHKALCEGIVHFTSLHWGPMPHFQRGQTPGLCTAEDLKSASRVPFASSSLFACPPPLSSVCNPNPISLSSPSANST